MWGIPEWDVDIVSYELSVSEAYNVVNFVPSWHEDEQKYAESCLREAERLWSSRTAPPTFGWLRSDALHEKWDGHLKDVWIQSLQDRVQVALNLGRHETVTAELADLTRQHPGREAFWRQRMIAEYRNDHQDDAVKAYRDACDALHKAGDAPSPALRNLHDRISNRTLSRNWP